LLLPDPLTAQLWGQIRHPRLAYGAYCASAQCGALQQEHHAWGAAEPLPL